MAVYLLSRSARRNDLLRHEILPCLLYIFSVSFACCSCFTFDGWSDLSCVHCHPGPRINMTILQFMLSTEIEDSLDGMHNVITCTK